MPTRPKWCKPGYPCPACKGRKVSVIDSRQAAHEETRWRRRRKCSKCGHRWTTYELHEDELINLANSWSDKLEAIRRIIEE